MSFLGIYGNKDEKFMADKLGKFMSFYLFVEDFNYLIVRGDKISTFLDSSDLMVIYYLFNKLANNRGLNVKWLSNADSFMVNVKSALEWAYQKKKALIFSYKPTAEAKEACKYFNSCRRKYKDSVIFSRTSTQEEQNQTYNFMENSFYVLFDLL